MADSSQYNLSLVITANNKAVEELNKIGASVDKVKWWVLNLSESTKKTLKTVWATATAIAGSVALLWKSFIDSALENEPLQRSFERLSQSAGIASEEMLNAMRKASRWTVADTKLMASANTALSLWVVKSADDMATLMEIARVKWQAMWRSMEEALDDIVRWLGRASPMILDNLWIVINQTEAQEEYAKTLWKTASELTEAEKKQALVNAVVKQWKAELLEAWDLQLTMAERLQIVNAQRENMKNTIGDALLPVVQRLLEAITPVIQRVADRIDKNPELTANIMIAVWAIAWLTAVVSWLALALPTIATAIGVLTWPIWRIAWAIALVAVARKNDWWNIQEITHTAIERIKEIIWPALEVIKERRSKHGETVMQVVWKLMWFIADTIWRTLAIITSWITLWLDAINVLASGFVALITGDFTSLKEDLNTIVSDIDSILTSIFGDMRTNIKNKFREWIDSVVGRLDDMKNKVLNIVWTLRDARESAKEATKNVVNGAVSKVSWLLKWKASWWDVYWWTPYMVWEHWPEMFVPSQSWRIVPTNQVSNAYGDVNINMNWITIRSEADIQSLADEITRRIKLEKNFWIA